MIISSNSIHHIKKTKEKKIVRLNIVILTNIKAQKKNDVSITDRSSNKLRVDVIRLGAFYVCDDTHDEILETIFHGDNYITMN